MRITLLIILLSLSPTFLCSQVVLTIEGQEIIDPELGVSYGYNIPRSQVTTLTFKNNNLISVNSAGYMLQAGDEVPGLNNNHLDGAEITGNKLTWNGTDANSWTHAMFTGYNLGVIIKYNYLTNTPNGIQRKSNGMTDVSGVVAYNIVKNPRVGIVVKGMNGVRIYNNTLYCEKTTTETGRGLIDIHANTDNGLNAPSTGVKVYNNIFYTKYQTYSINVMDQESLVGFESDYNVFYCETGSPIFSAGGVKKTFAEWQGMGYDLHSVILNPEFHNFNDFVPAARLDYGTSLGEEFQSGLAVDAVWSMTDPKTVNQNGTWQVGARIYEGEGNGEEELPQNMTKIYPSPAGRYFYVLLTDTNRIYQSLTLFDSTGRILLRRSVEYGLNRIQVPATFPSGLYNILLEAENLERYIRKIILLN